MCFRVEFSIAYEARQCDIQDTNGNNIDIFPLLCGVPNKQMMVSKKEDSEIISPFFTHLSNPEMFTHPQNL